MVLGTPRLVATDLDGTLLNSRGAITQRTREVLRALDARGVPVVFTTGRPIRWMQGLWEDVGGHGLAICSNGALVYDVTRRQVRDVHPVPPPLAHDLADRMRLSIPGTSLAIEHLQGWASEPSFPRHPDDASDRVQGSFEEIYRGDVVKILAAHRTLDPEEFWHQIAAATTGQVSTTWSSTFALVEISAKGVTKARALASLAAELGVAAEDVVAFGDMPNDLEMLSWAGTSYAMANAHPSVRAAAALVAPGNDEDGVARILAELFGLADR